MLIILIKLICSTLTTLSNILSFLVFQTLAYLIVSIIHALQAQGEAAHGVLEQVVDIIKLCFQSFVKFGMKVVMSLVSSGFNLLIEGVSGSASVTTSAIGGLVEKTKNSFDELMTDWPEVFEGVSNMVVTMATDLWNNYKDAFGYIKENA